MHVEETLHPHSLCKTVGLESMVSGDTFSLVLFVDDHGSHVRTYNGVYFAEKPGSISSSVLAAGLQDAIQRMKRASNFLHRNTFEGFSEAMPERIRLLDLEAKSLSGIRSGRFRI